MSKDLENQSQNNEIQLVNESSLKSIISYAPEHKEMVEIIQANLPELQRATSLFGKAQSQFMDNMLTVTHTTPLRNLRQILAEIEKTKSALKEAHFRTQKKSVEVRMKQRELENEKDELKKELLDIEVSELRSQAYDSGLYISGAVRALTNHIEQYNSIMKAHGIKDFNEIDFELEEEKYHIQKAFEQGLCAARSHQGFIDEGNMIYFTQLGINGSMAQAEVSGYLEAEKRMIQESSTIQSLLNNPVEFDKFKKERPLEVKFISKDYIQFPTHQMFLSFLEAMSSKYAGSAKSYAEYKGMTGTITESASLLTGDMRLLLNEKTT